MKDSTRQMLKEAFFEAAFVVLGVVLALAANEWRQSLADRERAAAALSGILEEIRTNRDAVQESFAYHNGLLEMLREAQKESRVPKPGEFSRGFIGPASVFRTAWNAASETGALTHMPYPTVLRLSKVYAQQESYEIQTRSAGELIYGELLRGGTQSIVENYVNLASLIASFSYRERQLLEAYEETLSALEAPR